MSYQTYLSQTQRIQSRQSHKYSSIYGFIVLSWFFVGAITPVYATKVMACQAQIVKRQAAQAIANDINQRPLTGWISIKQFPDLNQVHWENYTGNVWYKISWNYHCPPGLQYPQTLLINRMSAAGKIYLNDELLWQDSSLVEPLSRSWNMPRYWNLPVSSLKPGENVLWVLVIGVKTQYSGLGYVMIGNDREIMPFYNRFWYEQRFLLFCNLIFSLTLGVIAFLVWLFYRKDSVFGWFSLISLAWVLMMVNILLLQTPMGLTTIKIARLNTICLFAYAVFSCLFAWRLLNRRFAKLEKILFLLLVGTIVAAAVVPNANINLFLNLNLFIAVCITLANFLSYWMLAMRSNNIEAQLLAAVFIFYSIIVIHDLVLFIKVIEHAPWSPYSGPITTLLIAIILAMRLANNIRKVEKFNRTLEETVALAKNELQQTLNLKHYFEIRHTKLQERINLAHDLHDTLGASLVRSMAIVNQTQHNLNNQQFLSMLKLLRDDLRQIIDNDSSSGAIAPENPIIWGAAIRYRFMQIFEELEITSTWSFPEQWQRSPNALECLSLLRVIEEALTNVIKHSQARNVSVNLYYGQDQQLILEIIDDGIGLDVEAVMASGISVGIRSMQIRLAKIHAQLYISSRLGRTCIKVIQPHLM